MNKRERQKVIVAAVTVGLVWVLTGLLLTQWHNAGPGVVGP